MRNNLHRYYGPYRRARRPAIVADDPLLTSLYDQCRAAWLQCRRAWVAEARRIDGTVPRVVQDPNGTNSRLVWSYRPEYTDIRLDRFAGTATAVRDEIRHVRRRLDETMVGTVAAIFWAWTLLHDRLTGQSSHNPPPWRMAPKTPSAAPLRSHNRLSASTFSTPSDSPESMFHSNHLFRSQRPNDDGTFNWRGFLWTAATVTGTVGLMLLILLFQFLPTTQSNVIAAEELPPIEKVDDPFGGFPDPFAPVAVPEEDPEPLPTPEPHLTADSYRAELPYDVARFDLEEQGREFFVRGETKIQTSEPTGFDDWSLASRRRDSEPLMRAGYESSQRSIELGRIPGPSDAVYNEDTSPKTVAIIVEKSQPQTASSGTITYSLTVTNTGEATSDALVVEELIADPFRVADAEPAAAYEDGTLRWHLAGLRAGESHQLTVTVFAEDKGEGEFHSRATVRSVQSLAATTEVLGGKIRIRMTLPEYFSAGGDCPIRFEIENTGESPLTGVKLVGREDTPLRFGNDRDLWQNLGNLSPGETVSRELVATAKQAGRIDIPVEVISTEGIRQELDGYVDVEEPQPATTTTAAKPNSKSEPEPKREKTECAAACRMIYYVPVYGLY
ncbi:DUF11 domain-containing protein [Stratiformator vulcanicus]|uniref:DUF11 domain-containing protein n=1 Tax=Stratiformator vulcanicus TaxID=2527980 RepID=A0A517QXJ9_9PLAN|nr:DUF11 domain-containing protein [Stratiformator vulcanicus]QDT36300.1 hypothetical protein Pan189_06560 [Stratiformator vulcanicus]